MSCSCRRGTILIGCQVVPLLVCRVGHVYLGRLLMTSFLKIVIFACSPLVRNMNGMSIESNCKQEGWIEGVNCKVQSCWKMLY